VAGSATRSPRIAEVHDVAAKPSDRQPAPLLQFLAASPLIAHGALAQGQRPEDPVDWAPRELDKLIADPAQALDVFDFEPVMKKNVPPAHFGYMATGVDDELTLRANRQGFRDSSCDRGDSPMSARSTPAPTSSASATTVRS
jgi:hypothetical protein